MTEKTAKDFAKHRRLLTAKQFKQVFDAPSRKYHQSHLLIFVRDNEVGHARLGLAITKRKVPTAVARNQLKRLMREQFRLLADQLPEQDLVLIVKKPLTGLSKAELSEQIRRMLCKMTSG